MGLKDCLLLFGWFSQKNDFSLMPGCSSAAFTLTVCFTTVSFITFADPGFFITLADPGSFITLADPSSVIIHTLLRKFFHLTQQGITFGTFGFDFSHTRIVVLGGSLRFTGSLIWILYIDSYTLYC